MSEKITPVLDEAEVERLLDLEGKDEPFVDFIKRRLQIMLKEYQKEQGLQELAGELEVDKNILKKMLTNFSDFTIDDFIQVLSKTKSAKKLHLQNAIRSILCL